jgi:hypothetical protein
MKEGLLSGTLDASSRSELRRPTLMLHAGLDLSRRRLDVCLVDDRGELVGESAVPPDADGLRGPGCFCNPGAGEVAFTISRETLVGGEFGEGMILDDYVRAIGLPSGGAVRASLGLASDFADVHRFMRFAAEFVDLTGVPDDLPPRTTC